MKVNCLEGFRCREHCQKHCYDDNGYLYGEHYMFCGEEKMRSNIFKVVVIIVFTLTTTLGASIHCAINVPSSTNNMHNVLRILQSKDAVAQHRIAQLEAYIKNLESIDSTAGFSDSIKSLREATIQSIDRLKALEDKLRGLEQVDKDKLSTEERLKALEEYVAKLEQEAAQVLAVI